MFLAAWDVLRTHSRFPKAPFADWRTETAVCLDLVWLTALVVIHLFLTKIIVYAAYGDMWTVLQSSPGIIAVQLLRLNCAAVCLVSRAKMMSGFNTCAAVVTACGDDQSGFLNIIHAPCCQRSTARRCGRRQELNAPGNN